MARYVERNLPCKLTHWELLEKVKSLRATLKDKSLADYELEKAKIEHKTEMRKLEPEIAKLTLEIAEEEEIRTVKCDLVYNIEDWTVEEVRTDTGESIEKRAMTFEEKEKHRQFTMFPAGDDLSNVPSAEAVARQRARDELSEAEEAAAQSAKEALAESSEHLADLEASEGGGGAEEAQESAEEAIAAAAVGIELVTGEVAEEILESDPGIEGVEIEGFGRKVSRKRSKAKA